MAYLITWAYVSAALIALAYVLICATIINLGRTRTEMSKTREELDAAIAATPAAVNAAVADTLTTRLAPIISRLNASPEDYSAEVADLIALPQAVAANAASAITGLLTTTPTTTTPPATGTGTTPPTTTTTDPSQTPGETPTTTVPPAA